MEVQSGYMAETAEPCNFPAKLFFTWTVFVQVPMPRLPHENKSSLRELRSKSFVASASGAWCQPATATGRHTPHLHLLRRSNGRTRERYVPQSQRVRLLFQPRGWHGRAPRAAGRG